MLSLYLHSKTVKIPDTMALDRYFSNQHRDLGHVVCNHRYVGQIYLVNKYNDVGQIFVVTRHNNAGHVFY